MSFIKRTFISRSFKSLLTDWRFWLLEGVVVGLAALHDVLEGAPFMAAWGNLYFLPVALFWAPVLYSAWLFGSAGSAITAMSVLVAFIPNFLFWHQGSNRVAEITEVTVMVVTALLVGYLVDRVRTAQQRAKLYAGHALRIQEDELRRISRDLHDNVIQPLAALCRQLDSIKYFSPGLPSSASGELTAVRRSVEQMISDLRDFTKALRPFILDELGIVNSIRRLVEDSAGKTGFEVRVDVTGEERRLTAEQETYLFRITQEAVRNIEEHAKAGRVSVRIAFFPERVVLDIQDDGVGFEVPSDPGGFGRSGKFGIIGMLEHTELLGGRLEVESKPGSGTRIRVVIPLSVLVG
ncbi:MAG: hypothetical protein A2147_11445 [Chloroflexi bacterium RBG_16_57_8]|nr:MAG: hypothetical protein A2147_11445 [Chloroflexi bacterium RBG_16_57_8]